MSRLFDEVPPLHLGNLGVQRDVRKEGGNDRN